MSGLDFFIWALVVGYFFARRRLHRHQQQKRGQQ
jgi:hypothetical protein